jgi:hypothetical protein
MSARGQTEKKRVQLALIGFAFGSGRVAQNEVAPIMARPDPCAAAKAKYLTAPDRGVLRYFQ